MTDRRIYPDPLNPNYVRYSSAGVQGIRIYDPANHAINIYDETDLGWGSPNAFISLGTVSPDLNTGWVLGSGSSTTPITTVFDVDLPFSQIGLVPSTLISYMKLNLLGSGHCDGGNVSGTLTNPIIFFKKSLNSYLPNDVIIASGNETGFGTAIFTNNVWETHGYHILIRQENYDSIIQGVPGGYPSG